MTSIVHRISIPNPFFEGRNSAYLIQTDPLTLIDTGVATEKAFQSLSDGLRSHGISVSDIRRVILTHKHIDHIGNAWRIQQASGAEVLIHEAETKSLVDVDPSGKRFESLVHAKLDEWRVPEEARSKKSDAKMPEWLLEPCTPTGLSEGTELATAAASIKVLHTPGHTMGSICLAFGDTLFSGDHVLERISPNVGGGDIRSRGMLGRFLDSLDRVALLGDVEVHPGHDASFRGLQQRCAKLKQHHQHRLDSALKFVSKGECSVFDVATALYGKLKSFHVVLGCAEANAHLEYLVDQREIVAVEGRFRKA